MEATTEQRQYLTELNQQRTPQEKINSLPEEKSSPDMIALIIFLPLAMLADLTGAVSDLTIFLALPIRFLNLIIVGVLWLWRAMKTGIKKDYTWQLLLVFLIETSPFGFIPTWTLFVLYVYFKDTSLGKQTLGRIKKINKLKVK
jgi:hypothetical protein